ncbi:MAG: trypsin-like peptidase domain-containing protein [Oligoflexia bacterium]|nr:trypsin-like peptidase domain-containing protein [Oligoflexia bacterium]
MIHCTLQYLKLLLSPFLLLSLLSSLFSLFSCANPDSSAPKFTDLSSLRFGQFNSVQQITDSIEVSCANNSDSTSCSPSVGMLLGIMSKTDTDLYSCTSFLLSNGLIVTNSHCIPSDLKTANNKNNCLGRIKIFFPAAGNYPAENFDCASIEFATKTTNKDKSSSYEYPDYALIRLKGQVNRLGLEPSREGFIDNQIYHVYKITTSSSDTKILGTLEDITCKARLHTLIVPSSSNPLTWLSALSDCKTTLSNSGSPVVDQQGKVHGIIYASPGIEGDNDAYGSIIDIPWKNWLIDGTNEMSKITSVTNFACLPLSGYSPTKEELQKCNQTSLDDSNANTNNFFTKLIEDANNTLTQWMKTTGYTSVGWDGIVYAVEVDDRSFPLLIIPIPKCYTNELNEMSKTFDLTVVQYLIGLNHYWQLTSKNKDYITFKSVQLKMTFDFIKKDNGQEKAIVTSQLEMQGENTSEQESLNLFKAEIEKNLPKEMSPCS